MKYIAPTAALALIASQSVAGTLTEPVVEEVMEPQTKAASSASWAVPLLLLGVVAAVVASGGDDDEVAEEPTTTDCISIGCGG